MKAVIDVEDIEWQLNEVDMLKAMFPLPGEFEFLDAGAAALDLQSWASGVAAAAATAGTTGADQEVSTWDPPPTLTFRLNLRAPLPGGVRQDTALLGVEVTLPHGYPGSQDPDVHVKGGDLLTRDGQARLNADLRLHVAAARRSQNSSGSPPSVSGNVVTWLQENAASYLVRRAAAGQDDDHVDVDKVEETGKDAAALLRLWVLSHHIYSTTKRRNILDLSKDHQLTGFCMPGKPGVICWEGPPEACRGVWNVVRGWNWQKIGLKLEEQDLAGSGGKFGPFEEVSFPQQQSSGRHGDLGQLGRFLKDHRSGHVFKDIFGVELHDGGQP